ncbi:MAG: carboxypeptidase-like regulatory domain-containing protein [Flavobacteriales bacterium]
MTLFSTRSGFFILCSVLLLLPGILVGQKTATLKGTVKSAKDGDPLPYVNIKVKNSGKGTFTDNKGKFGIELKAGKAHVVQISHAGYQTWTDTIELKKGAVHRMVVSLEGSNLKGPVIRGKRVNDRSMMPIPTESVRKVPTASGDFVAKTLSSQPGVSINNELSSSYSVRGGNFDENMIYVNDVRIFRPFLVRSGRQEGLNFVNGDLVSSILFSAGGFEPRYGDRMSSVLDIQYKRPKEFGGSVKGGLLGGSVHLQGATEGYRFTAIGGVRYRQNSYLLNSLETKGTYKPDFTDAQAFLTYDISDVFELGFLGHYSRNRYRFKPGSRTTNFGTINTPLQLSVDFNGQERDLFQTFTGALIGKYRPTPDLELKGIVSSFRSDEAVTFDLDGSYRLDRIDNNPGSEEFGDVIQNRGFGSYQQHARNVLLSRIHSFSHKGVLDRDERTWEWGITYRYQRIRDRLKEWQRVDSAGYSLPHPQDSLGYEVPSLQPDHELRLNRSVRSDIKLIDHRGTAYLQHTWTGSIGDTGSYDLTVGGRGHIWSRNEQWLLSPRATFTMDPGWFTPNDTLAGDRMRFRFATGVYYQAPMYREIRDLNGNIHPNVKAQRSIHFVLGGDYAFKAWGRPFMLTTELYYKALNHLNPYELDNVRIRYYANNKGKGYATGIDMKINGEFIPGLESWASISLMKTEAKIADDAYFIYHNPEGERVYKGSGVEIADSTKREPGYIPRPTDQRVNISLFFQDELPRWPSYKVHLKGIYGSGLPFGPPSFERYKDTLRMPPYRRVDIGFSKDLLHPDSKLKDKPFFRHFDSFILRLSVFNLLNIRNTISHLWIRDVSGNRFAVPNRSTGRLINFTIRLRF